MLIIAVTCISALMHLKTQGPRRNTTERRERKRREKQKSRVKRRIKGLRKLTLNLGTSIIMIIQVTLLLADILKRRLATQGIKMQ